MRLTIVLGLLLVGISPLAIRAQTAGAVQQGDPGVFSPSTGFGAVTPQRVGPTDDRYHHSGGQSNAHSGTQSNAAPFAARPFPTQPDAQDPAYAGQPAERHWSPAAGNQRPIRDAVSSRHLQPAGSAPPIPAAQLPPTAAGEVYALQALVQSLRYEQQCLQQKLAALDAYLHRLQAGRAAEAREADAQFRPVSDRLSQRTHSAGRHPSESTATGGHISIRREPRTFVAPRTDRVQNRGAVMPTNYQADAQPANQRPGVSAPRWTSRVAPNESREPPSPSGRRPLFIRPPRVGESR